MSKCRRIIYASLILFLAAGNSILILGHLFAAELSAFTLAHSITLSVLNIVRLPSNIVEPMIRASIY
jgi:hypothetical protein